MSDQELQEYRRRQHELFLQRKRGAQTGNNDNATTDLTQQQRTTPAGPSSCGSSVRSCNSAPSIAAAAAAVASTETTVASHRPMGSTASPQHAPNTTSDAFLAQYLAQQLEQEEEAAARRGPAEEVDDATAAVISQLIEADAFETSELRPPDRVFREQLIDEASPPVAARRRPRTSPPPQLEEDEDQALARRLQEEEYLRDNPRSAAGTTQTIPSPRRFYRPPPADNAVGPAFVQPPFPANNQTVQYTPSPLSPPALVASRQPAQAPVSSVAARHIQAPAWARHRNTETFAAVAPTTPSSPRTSGLYRGPAYVMPSPPPAAAMHQHRPVTYVVPSAATTGTTPARQSGAAATLTYCAPLSTSLSRGGTSGNRDVPRGRPSPNHVTTHYQPPLFGQAVATRVQYAPAAARWAAP